MVGTFKASGRVADVAERANAVDQLLAIGIQNRVARVSLAVELQRDWARQDTVQAIIEIVLTDRLLKEQ